MFIRITREKSASVCTHDAKTGHDLQRLRSFHEGEIYCVCKVYELETSTTFEVDGLGVVELSDDSWATYDHSLFIVDPYKNHLN